MANPTSSTAAAAPSYAVNEPWLAKRREAALDPDLPIIDPHHHLWRREHTYLVPELLADIKGGHNVRATVFIECASHYREGGDPVLAPLGETEFARACADQATGDVKVCAGIVGTVDLRVGERARNILEQHIAIGRGHFRGIRNMSTWDDDPLIPRPVRIPGPNLLQNADFRKGFAALAPLGLSFDAWLFHHQIHELVDLAEAFPDTVIVLDHVGGVVGLRGYAGKRAEILPEWRKSMIALGKRPNVCVKVGGLGMPIFGFGFQDQPMPPSSEDLAAQWKPYVETCIEAFGVDRCMFESNFPVDKISCDYTVLWNAFKRLTKDYSATEKRALFHDTAARTYRL
jgi:predicted TIM-barrel fold metal-dependent hydrolase